MIKLLVAEDEERSRAAMVSRLRSLLGEAAMVEWAADGAEAIDKAQKIRPDMIFMDIEMPRKNGLEAAEIIKRTLPETVIVFLTAYDRFDYAVGALRSGGDDYMLKPASEADLREMLQKFFDDQAELPASVSPFETELRVWLHRHYAEDITLEAAAENMGMSPFYFSRQIKAVTGSTFLDYLTDYRIEKAKRRLRHTDMTVSEVGRSVGYPDSNYFSKVFKRATGRTPTVYRNEGNTET